MYIQELQAIIYPGSHRSRATQSNGRDGGGGALTVAMHFYSACARALASVLRGALPACTLRQYKNTDYARVLR